MVSIRKKALSSRVNLFPGCSNIPLCEMISRHTNGTPVTLVNDADAAILAEKWIGVGRKYDDLVFMTLGSGIGVGIVVNGQVVSGMTGTIEEVIILLLRVEDLVRVDLEAASKLTSLQIQSYDVQKKH